MFLGKNLPSVIPTTTDCDIIILESHAAPKRREQSVTAANETTGRIGSTIDAAVGLGQQMFPLLWLSSMSLKGTRVP